MSRPRLTLYWCTKCKAMMASTEDEERPECPTCKTTDCVQSIWASTAESYGNGPSTSEKVEFEG